MATCLAFLSFASVSFDGTGPVLRYRSHEQWASNTRLLLTQPGFKWGYTNVGGLNGLSSQAAVEGRLPGLANIYSSFVTSDHVMRIMLREGPVKGAVTAAALPAGPSSSSVLPIVNVRAIAFSPRGAILLANRAAEALRTYVEEQQTENGVPPRERVQLAVLNAGFETQLVLPRKKTVPIVVFLAVMFATLAIAFTLENMRPRPSTAPMADLERVESPTSRVA